ncbi:MAG: HIT family protein [Nanoarchaeota archaeon]
MTSCPFCDFKDEPLKIHDDEHCYAIISKRPINKYHVLVIPRKHYESIVELPDDLAAHLFVVAKRMSGAVREACRPDAITHLSDDDIKEKGFNLVRHFKIHIIPRFDNDKVKIDWGRDTDPGIDARTEYTKRIQSFL